MRLARLPCARSPPAPRRVVAVAGEGRSANRAKWAGSGGEAAVAVSAQQPALAPPPASIGDAARARAAVAAPAGRVETPEELVSYI
jgi:hypothetical protein